MRVIFPWLLSKNIFQRKNYKDVFDLLNLTKQKDEKVKNEVHENKIWIERVTKEKYNAKLTTVCNPNPRLAFFQFTPMHAFLVACFSGLYRGFGDKSKLFQKPYLGRDISMVQIKLTQNLRWKKLIQDLPRSVVNA